MAKIRDRYITDTKQLKNDCVDIVSKCYLMLGQKPDAKQIIMMSQLLYDDLVNMYGGFTIDEVKFAFEQGVRHSDNGGFVNVRNFNLWLKEYDKKACFDRSQNRLTDYQRYESNIKQINTTINKAKQLKK